MLEPLCDFLYGNHPKLHIYQENFLPFNFKSFSLNFTSKKIRCFWGSGHELPSFNICILKVDYFVNLVAS